MVLCCKSFLKIRKWITKELLYFKKEWFYYHFLFIRVKNICLIKDKHAIILRDNFKDRNVKEWNL
ncbi:hypothetical protein EXS78_05650 [Helicobacter pylori]|nr:hypothetical protein [Helicobacter pylori]